MLVVKEKWAEARKQKISTRWEYNFEGQDFLFFFFFACGPKQNKVVFLVDISESTEGASTSIQ